MHSRSLRIAIADDEVDMRDYFQKVLPRWGHQVVCAAENGTDLVASCKKNPPDLIITDLKMPFGDGIWAIPEIWRDQSIPVIVVSAFPHDIPESLRDHHLLAAVLIKPIKTTDLEPVVEQIARANVG